MTIDPMPDEMVNTSASKAKTHRSFGTRWTSSAFDVPELGGFSPDRTNGGMTASCSGNAMTRWAHLVIALPLQLAVMPPLVRSGENPPSSGTSKADEVQRVPNERWVFALLALVLTISSGIGSIVIVHMMTFLQARGADFALAITLGTLFGPAQVGARVIERLFGARYHPIWTMIASCTLMAAGLLALSGSFAILSLTILVYGAGYGIMWIARGTLPLAVFGPRRYATLIGRIAFPALIVQALAPSAGALLIEMQGPGAAMAVLAELAVLNTVLVAVLWAACRRPSSS